MTQEREKQEGALHRTIHFHGVEQLKKREK